MVVAPTLRIHDGVGAVPVGGVGVAPAPGRPAAGHALDHAARSEITRLRAENRSLPEQIARRLGLQRTQHGEHTSAEPR